MPIPQFHRTPRTRRRRARRGAISRRSGDAHDAEAAIAPAQEPVDSAIPVSLDDAAPLPAHDDAAADQGEIPALLSHWPPERRKSS